MKRWLPALALTVMALAACSSSGSTGPTPTVTNTVVTTVAGTHTPSSTPSSTQSHSSASAVPVSPVTASAGTSAAPVGNGCTNAQLTVTHRGHSGGDGHSGIVAVFTNSSRVECSLHGYPGVAVLDKSGKQIVQAKRTKSGYLGGCGCAPSTVRLKPGATASALIEGDVGGGAECLRGRALLVTPPNTTRSTKIAFSDYSCHVQVHPTVAGTSGGTH